MKRTRGGLAAGIAGLLLAGLLHGSAWALTDEEIFRDFRFNFVNPGARSLGMGGAFIATGDDATAGQSNPAALHYVSKSEFFVEFREVRPDTQVFSPSRAFGDIGDVTARDLPFLRLNSVTDREDASLPSFVSFASPFSIGGRKARVAVSRQVVLDVESSLTDDKSGLTTNLQFATQDFPEWVNPNDPNVQACTADPTLGVRTEIYSICNSVDGRLDTDLVHYNLAFSYSLTDNFSVGLTATYATLDMQSEVLSVSSDPRGILSSVHPRVSTATGLTPIQVRSSIDDSDSGFAYTLGLHWHPDTAFPNRGEVSPIRFGLVYRKGADLSVEESTAELDAATGQFTVTRAFENRLRVPDRIGLGMSYEAWGHWTFALDVEHIEYSDLLEDYQKGINFFTGPFIQSTFFSIDPDQIEFDVDDAVVLHAGVEYFFVSSGSWGHAIRAGYFNAPDNRIRLSRISSGDADIDRLFKDVFRGGEDVDHYTTGFSLNTPAGIRLQFAADFSDAGDEYLASAIYRFGKTR